MTKATLLSILAIASLGLAQPSRAGVLHSLRGTDVTVSIASAKIPSGFDPTDVVSIVSGYYPNSCYAWSRADVNNLDAYTHEIKAIAFVAQGACLTVLVPFSEEVHLGSFEKGHHTLRYMNGDGTYFEQSLDVE